MGKLNKFALAPGSLSDIGAVGEASTPAAKPVKKPAAPVKTPET